MRTLTIRLLTIHQPLRRQILKTNSRVIRRLQLKKESRLRPVLSTSTPPYKRDRRIKARKDKAKKRWCLPYLSHPQSTPTALIWMIRQEMTSIGFQVLLVYLNKQHQSIKSVWAQKFSSEASNQSIRLHQKLIYRSSDNHSFPKDRNL